MMSDELPAAYSKPAHLNDIIIIFSQKSKLTLSFHCVLFIRNTVTDYRYLDKKG